MNSYYKVFEYIEKHPSATKSQLIQNLDIPSRAIGQILAFAIKKEELFELDDGSLAIADAYDWRQQKWRIQSNLTRPECCSKAMYTSGTYRDRAKFCCWICGSVKRLVFL